MIYCKNIVDIKPVFYSSRDFETTFFFPIFGNAIITIAKKKKKNYSPISAMTLPPLPFFIYFKSTPHSGTLRHTGFGRKTGQWNFGNAIAEIQRFSLSSFPYSLSCFLVEFRQCHCRNSVSLLNFPIIFE